ncbi:hypothetical protein [Sphingobacterium paucimobilis]|uniref:Uncharacterized protein n=1 Tax=Sphingobacterium paucimobilis HER1398 TaxID=1346330 RepID=U2HPE7_9SPHI|nr:hypothetical protein [Sphingobacterium paucimobilis]ERJ57347.1 hypothetical protein M472_01070 [Sphingobacterium paucimobilis HER1398]
MALKRTDISEYIIHFLRRQDIKDLPFVYELGGQMWFAEDNNTASMTEMECLFNIVSEGGLRGSFSFRRGKATIYGFEPAICFTEMPIVNLLEYRNVRRNTYRVSNYGIAIRKNEFFKRGGRPVIYGLSANNNFEFDESSNDNSSFRIIKDSILPIKEQYRYVAFQLGEKKEIDWTHEREWRIIGQDEIWINDELYLDGLHLFDVDDFSEVILIVKSKTEALALERHVRTIQEGGYTPFGEFSSKIKFLVLDLALKEFNGGKVKSIEDLSEAAFYTFKYTPLEQERIETLHKVLDFCRSEAKRLGEEYLKKHRDSGFCGWCNIVSVDTDNPTVRYLFENDMVFVYNGQYALKDIFNLAPHAQSLDYKSFLAQKICEILNTQYEDIFYVVSHDD